MADLQPVGVPGPQELRNLLTTCNDPLSAIQEFQRKNSVQLASLAPALKFLDMHHVRRSEFHEAVMVDLRDRLLAKINELGAQAAQNQGEPKKREEAKRLDELVAKSFKLVRAVRLRPVILEALNALPKVPKKYLQEIRDDPDLYRDVGINVRQQIWEQTPEKFLEEIQPQVAQYIDEKRAQLQQLDTFSPVYFSESGKTRRQSASVQSLAQTVGRHLKLYDQLLQYIREQFYETQNAHLCSLRSELLMALHDADIQELTSVDPCHKFAWCLDACVRERHLDGKHALEMKGVLDGVKSRNREQILGDLAMIAGDPHAVHFLVQLILKVLHQGTASETLPREHGALHLVLRLLNLGLWSWRLMKSGDFKEPKIESIIYTKFLSSLMTLIIEDNCRLLVEKLPEAGVPDDLKRAAVERWSMPPSETLTVFVKSEPLCASLFAYYSLELARKRDRFGLIRLAPTLRRTFGDWACSEEFLMVFMSALAPIFIESSPHDELLYEAVFDKHLLIKAAANDGEQSTCCKAQLLRFVYFLGGRSTIAGKRDQLMEQLKPTQQEENGWYERLYERVSKRLIDSQTLGMISDSANGQSVPASSSSSLNISTDYAAPPSVAPFGMELTDVPIPMTLL